MRFSRLAAGAVGAAIVFGFSSLACAQDAPYGQSSQYAPYGQSPRYAGSSMYGTGRNELSPEERVMWRMEHRGEMASMTDEQRRDYRRQSRQQFRAMSPQQQASFRERLDARWAGLPQQRQQAIEQRLSMRQQARYSGQSGGGGYYGSPSYNGYGRQNPPGPYQK